MSKVERLRERARTAEARDPRAAIVAWTEVLRVQEDEGDPNPDLSIYNRIGDLYLKAKDPGQAADFYERGVEKYAELGFHNNAIALCNKVLRNAPGRPSTYLKLAKLYAAKGFLAEARQNFVEYAERMKRAGNLEHAFAALKQVTDLSPESDNLREMLEEHLRTYGDVQRKPVRASGQAEAPAPPEPKVQKRKTSSLVFLDLDEPSPAPAAKPAAPPAPAPPRPARPEPPRRKGPEREVAETTASDDGQSLVLEPTSAPDVPSEPPADASLLAGFETTSVDFDDVRDAAGKVGGISEEAVEQPPKGGPVRGLEPTTEETEEAEEEVEEPPRRAAPPPRSAPAPAPAPPPARATPPASPPPRARPPIDVPPLELEPEFADAVTEPADDLDDEPLLVEGDEALSGWIITSDELAAPASGGSRAEGYIDLGLEGVISSDELAGRGFEVPGGAAAPPSIEDLEARVADNPDDADAHRSLGEALIEAGDRDRGIEELDLAAEGYEAVGNLQQAQDLIDEILRLDPNSVRHRQRAVENAYKAGHKDQLVEAYLELADALLRNNLPDKAHAVYQRVAEHDPGNARAQAALSMLAAPEPSAPAKPTGRVPAKDAKMRVRDDVAVDGDFVDLGALVLEDDAGAARDTRMRVEDEAPSGDEERDFKEMLARFKQGIDENIDETDFQSHYDLGVAFKEMGLLDEAISEFQKALRAPEGKLRTSEALGVCFLEKGALGVAESILRRGLELPAGGDPERLGILYWLGRALEAQGKVPEARDYYGRAFAVDIRFMDVGDRVKALSRV